MEKPENRKKPVWSYFELLKYALLPLLVVFLSIGDAHAAATQFTILGQLNYIKFVLNQVGPALSAILFIIAGIFYAIGQLMPPDKKANFHTTAVNIIIGAVVVAVLSVASTSFANASTHLLSNFTVNSISNVS
ncbi:MAG: hypothetical protein M1331_03030 [Candidatus Marsarchaeota archaeon]|nr:hypothetical protein [Candidatus Marsarchaeota archaeon]MCL5106340.1 hypothetical protein [Candidatus Marsarchaeota archaeon]